MKIVIDDNCIACGVCVDICPDVFELGDDKALVIEGADTNADCVQEAIDSCPTQSISIEE